MSGEVAKSAEKKGASKMAGQEILEGFKRLREDQQTVVAKIAELRTELHEHKCVADTVEKVDPKRKCHRLMGGVLVEQTAGEVLPTLRTKIEKLSQVIETLENKLTEINKNLSDYREKHNIRFMTEEQLMQEKLKAQQQATSDKDGKSDAPTKAQSSNPGVLVE